jgi:hypothetical protein
VVRQAYHAVCLVSTIRRPWRLYRKFRNPIEIIRGEGHAVWPSPTRQISRFLRRQGPKGTGKKELKGRIPTEVSEASRFSSSQSFQSYETTFFGFQKRFVLFFFPAEKILSPMPGTWRVFRKA